MELLSLPRLTDVRGWHRLRLELFYAMWGVLPAVSILWKGASVWLA